MARFLCSVTSTSRPTTSNRSSLRGRKKQQSVPRSRRVRRHRSSFRLIRNSALEGSRSHMPGNAVSHQMSNAYPVFPEIWTQTRLRIVAAVEFVIRPYNNRNFAERFGPLPAFTSHSKTPRRPGPPGLGRAVPPPPSGQASCGVGGDPRPTSAAAGPAAGECSGGLVLWNRHQPPNTRFGLNHRAFNFPNAVFSG